MKKKQNNKCDCRFRFVKPLEKKIIDYHWIMKWERE